jgi:hypothetical protein
MSTIPCGIFYEHRGVHGDRQSGAHSWGSHLDLRPKAKCDKWYCRPVASPDVRILVMFGTGHLYLLQQFFSESGRFAVDSAQMYLM